jgi:hypothetical protein
MARMKSSAINTASTTAPTIPYHYYLLPPKALINSNRGYDLLLHKSRGCPTNTSKAVLQEYEGWTLKHDLKNLIGVGNDDILDYDKDKFDGSDNNYFLAKEEDCKDYEWKDDAPRNRNNTCGHWSSCILQVAYKNAITSKRLHCGWK